MSFDIFLQCFRNGQPAPISLELFESIFLPHDTHPEAYEDDPGYLTLEYPDGGGGVLHCDGIATRGGMMFNHCGGKSFWDDIYRLADRTGSVIYWPSPGPHGVVTREEVLKELPQDGFDLSVIKVVRNSEEIGEAIQNSP